MDIYILYSRWRFSCRQLAVSMPHLAHHHHDTQILDFIGLIRACPTRSNFLGIRLIVIPEQSTSHMENRITHLLPLPACVRCKHANAAASRRCACSQAGSKQAVATAGNRHSNSLWASDLYAACLAVHHQILLACACMCKE
jgi:hypothetical protein